MNDLFRAIFGIPASNREGERMDGRVPQGYRTGSGGNSGDDDDDDFDDEDNDVNMRRGPQGGIFGFPAFNEPMEFHRQLGKLLNDMNKAFGVFGFNSGPSITWEGGIDSESSALRDDGKPKEPSLRDEYLKKPDCGCNNISQKDDFNIRLNINTADFQPGTSNNSNSVQYSYPKVYSKSVFIQTVRRPDGSVETIKKVRDHEGNEETTISQSHVSDLHPPTLDDQLIPKEDKEDTSGLSIFKKFFPF